MPLPLFRLLLIECDVFFFSEEKGIHVNEAMPPIGLMYLSSFLKKHLAGEARVEVGLIDMAVERLTRESLSAQPTPQLIGLRALTKNKELFHQTAALCREIFPEVPIIGGGPYVTADYDAALLDPHLECGVSGEGEYPLLEMARRLLAGDRAGLLTVNGVVRRDGVSGEILQNPPQQKPDLNAEPMPDYSLIDMDRFAQVICNAKVKRRQGVITASRGCPFQCIYCHNIFGRKIRARTPENVLDEISYLYHEHQVRDFFFVDDVFNISAKRTIGLCNLIQQSGLKIHMYFQNGFRGDLCTREVVDACVEAGMILVNFAVESSSPRLQALMKKNLDVDKLAEMIHYTCTHDIIVGINSMIGFPSETLEEAEGTIRYLAQFKKVALPFFFIARYYPHTEMYAMAVADGFPQSMLDRHSEKVYHDVTLPTPTLSAGQLQGLFQKYLVEVFFNRERLENVQRILQRFFTPEDIRDFYSTLLNRRIVDVEREVLGRGFGPTSESGGAPPRSAHAEPHDRGEA
ncbi:MAG: B12-binding domain-containing radical SAM protein [Magnetococcales bacterium]|nr:B12-binding domain-containing radical SAM protein [Magnetococcales bacterium]